jgi:hypothetical protein
MNGKYMYTLATNGDTIHTVLYIFSWKSWHECMHSVRETAWPCVCFPSGKGLHERIQVYCQENGSYVWMLSLRNWLVHTLLFSQEIAGIHICTHPATRLCVCILPGYSSYGCLFLFQLGCKYVFCRIMFGLHVQYIRKESVYAVYDTIFQKGLKLHRCDGVQIMCQVRSCVLHPVRKFRCS